MTENNNQELFDDVYNLFNAEKKTEQFWFRMMIAMVVCQFGAMAYDITLPVSQGLSMPFFFCFILAMISGFFPRKRRQKHLDRMRELVREREDEHYRLVTGENKR